MTVPMTAPDGSRGAAPLLRASASMIATTVLTAGAGFAFWTVAARHWDTASVGHAAAALSAVAVVAVLSSQTVSASLLGRMPRAADAHGLLACGLVTTGSVALALAVVVRAGVVPAVPALASLRTPAMTALFLLVCVAHGVAATADAASVALRSSRVMTGRAAAHGFGKLAVVVAVAAIAPGVPATPALLGSWTALSIVTTARAAAVLLRLARSTSEPRDRRGSPWRELLRGSAAQTVAGVGGALPPQLLPLLVAARAGASAAAVFSLTWQVGCACFTISPGVCTALLAEGAHAPEELHRRVGEAARLIVGLLLVPAAVLLLGAHAVLGIFGAHYAAAGAGLLVVLVASSAPDAVTNVATAVWRVQERLHPPALVNLAIALVALSGAWLAVPSLGIVGAGLAWLFAQVVGCAAVAAIVARPRRARSLVRQECVA